MAREIPFTPPPSAPARAIERTVQLSVAVPADADGMITVRREKLILAQDGSVLGSEPAPTVFRKLSEVKDDPQVAALIQGIAAKIDAWAEQDATPPAPLEGQDQG